LQHLKLTLKWGAEVAGGLSPPREGQQHGWGSWGGRTLGWSMEKHYQGPFIIKENAFVY